MTYPGDDGQVRSELIAGDALSISAAARLLRINPATIWRWLTKGIVVSATGERVFLAGCRIGCSWRISRGALARFAEKTSAGRLKSPAGPPTQGKEGRSAQRQREIDAAKARLRQMGV